MEWKERKYRAYVFMHISEGDVIKVPKDLYNDDRTRTFTERKVLKFYDHYVLTVDEYGKSETFQYYDVYCFINGRKGNEE